MVCLGQVKAEQVQHPHNKVEYPRNPKVQCEGCHKVASQIANIHHFCRRNGQVIVNETVKEQVRDAPKHPLHTSLVDLKLLTVVVGSAERPVVHNREERESNVWKQEERRAVAGGEKIMNHKSGQHKHRNLLIERLVS